MPTLIEHVRDQLARHCAAAGVAAPAFGDGAVRAALLAEGFDPAEPRDGHGRWTAGASAAAIHAHVARGEHAEALAHFRALPTKRAQQVIGRLSPAARDALLGAVAARPPRPQATRPSAAAPPARPLERVSLNGKPLGAADDFVKSSFAAVAGKDVDLHEALAAAAVTDGASVRVTLSSLKNHVTVDVDHPDYTAHRALIREKDGSLTMYNSEIRVKNPGRGLGAEIFARQVGSCQRLGCARMECSAAGRGGDGTKMNGALTWPKFGYDADVDGALREAAAKAGGDYARARTLHDLLRLPDGARLIADHYEGGPMTFNLAPGSNSRQIFDAYRARKAARGNG